MYRYILLLFVVGFFSCSNENLEVQNELSEINRSLQVIIHYNYEYIENEYNKYPEKLNSIHEKTILLKSENQRLNKIISREQLTKGVDFINEFGNYLNVLKDSIFLKIINYQKDSLYIENDEYTRLIFNQVSNILKIESTPLKNNLENYQYLLENKKLVVEQIVTEYLKHSLYRYDFHFNRFQTFVIHEKPDQRIKLGEKFRAEIILNAVDRAVNNPLFVFSKIGTIEDFENTDIYRKKLVHSEIPYYLKSNSSIINDTLIYKDKIYLYESKPTKKGRYSFGGEIMLISPTSGEVIGFPFISEYVVE